ncbi:MAG: glycine-rich domain-containing protein, partial [Burkholderiales bacterium]
MQSKKLTTKPTHEVLSAIQALDLESVKIRLMDEELGEGWSRDYAETIEAAYKTYLTMLAKHQDHAEDIMLAKDVDEFWHTHILQTMKYADDCEKVFGAFLHHNPHVGPRTTADLQRRAEMAEKTRRIYAQEFADAQDTAWSGGVVNTKNA